MADLKISALPAASVALAGTEVLPIVQSSTTKQVTVANLTAGRAVATGALAVTGDATLSTGNIVQGTAAKGINFTANTPAAGMTSQLLNWYEEGTFTATDGSGALLAINCISASYTKIGRNVTIQIFVIYPATADVNNVVISGLPFVQAGSNQITPITAISTSGVAIGGYIPNASSDIWITSGADYGARKTNADLTSAGVLISASYHI